jgi:hypothetical protein
MNLAVEYWCVSYQDAGQPIKLRIASNPNGYWKTSRIDMPPANPNSAVRKTIAIAGKERTWSHDDDQHQYDHDREDARQCRISLGRFLDDARHPDAIAIRKARSERSERR